MKHLGLFWRLLFIQSILLRYRLDSVLLDNPYYPALRFVLILFPWNWLPSAIAKRPKAERVRLALEALGPIFVKFGQMMSTRRDLLPDDYARELTRLQDEVPPFDGARARQLIEQGLGCAIEDAFVSFDPVPLASASVAQVHAATLPDGRAVVIKVLRPGIEPVIQRDVGLLYVIARLAHRIWPEAGRLRLLEVVGEFEGILHDELNLMREAANATQLRRNFADQDLLTVPEVYWELTRRQLMTMERVYGTPISHKEQLQQQGVDLQRLAEDGVKIFYTQVFRDSFFHADMHPGNIWVSEAGRYIALDFGIMGTLNPDDKHYLAENFLAFFNRDYRRVAELHLESGWVPADTRVDQFEAAIRTVCEPIFDRPLKDISFGHLLMNLFQTARRFNMEVQPQLVLLQKTLLNIEGLGRQLYPDLDLWKTAKPFLEDWMKQQVGPQAAWDQLKTESHHWLQQWPKVPRLLVQSLEQLQSGRLEVAPGSVYWQQWQQQQRQGRSVLRHSMLMLGWWLMAVLWYGSGRIVGEVSWQVPLALFVLGCWHAWLARGAERG